MFNTKKIENDLALLSSENRLRTLRTIESAPDKHITLDGKAYLNFASNNYLSLAHHPEIQKAIQESVTTSGNGATGSRLLGGNFSAHIALEKALAEFKHVEGALLFNSGYCANLGIITTFADKNSHVYSDKLNHASIVDGIRLSGAKLHRYNHCDIQHLESLLQKDSGEKIIVTDALFSMDGTCAPLESLAELAEKYGALLVVDEAHSDGIFGSDGRGLVAELHLTDKVDLCMGTFGKSYGCFGAAVSGKKLLIEYLIQKCRSFTYTTALPPYMARSIQTALEVSIAEPWRRESLREKSATLRVTLMELGFNIGDSVSQIIPIIVGDNESALQASKELEAAGIWVPAIREPTVPRGSARLRINVIADHTEEDITRLVAALCQTTWYKNNGTH